MVGRQVWFPYTAPMSIVSIIMQTPAFVLLQPSIRGGKTGHTVQALVSACVFVFPVLGWDSYGCMCKVFEKYVCGKEGEAQLPDHPKCGRVRL